ncbi:MAG: hydantoin utilization protein A [Pleurocapsa sp. SU_5_0]|nr:hydantoin utilization protein A [Pleurocapsa sp. SU_5_0]NJO96743.1 hydantoin utilization protein A [Pleurocapsa sp. CRU_1_2]NJR47625.1 hydantoin utilization protein A [Hyellaceae cyanobacterium CSU_1_1]
MNKKAIAFGLAATVFLSINLLFNAAPALAHHAMGGNLPNNFGEGFISGLAHPVIGIDHLVFVIAIGLLAALSKKVGIVMPAIFVTATAVGAGIHLQGINLPAPELIISTSVLAMGIFLARESQANLSLLTGLAALAGIFHGYAYAESVFGVEMTTLGAYLLGFSLIQLIISAIAFYTAQALNRSAVKSPLSFRFAGFAICGVGFTFLANVVLGLLFPV